jgi:hypothetical protein
MATLLLWLSVPVIATGCLIPQDDQVLPVLPPQKNLPPRVIHEKSVPQHETTQYVGNFSQSGCPRPSFTVFVEDDNLSDTQQRDLLRSIWFVDPPPELQIESSLFGDAVSSTDAVRSLSSPAAVATALTSLIDGRRHVVSMVVTDGTFPAAGSPTSVTGTTTLLSDGTYVTDQAYTDYEEWLVEVQPCP